MSRVNRAGHWVERALLGVLYRLTALAFGGSTLGFRADRYAMWSAIIVMALIGAYHTVKE